MPGEVLRSGAFGRHHVGVVPSRYLRKYSLPFAEEPKRLERHSVSVRGQFSGASGSSTAILIVPAASALAT